MNPPSNDAVNRIFGGTVQPVITSLPADPREALGRVIGIGINLFILVVIFFLLIYMLWGAFDWITSSGEKEKIAKAQNKIVNALLGMFIAFGVLSLFGIITGNILGLFIQTPTGWIFNIPTL